MEMPLRNSGSAFRAKLPLIAVGISLAGCVTHRDRPEPRRLIHLDFPSEEKNWEMQHENVQSFGILKEFVPAGDSVKSWREIVTQTVILTQKNVEDFADLRSDSFTRSDPEIDLTRKVNEDGSITLTYTSHKGREFAIRRYIQGPDGIYEVSYHVRLPLKKDAPVSQWDKAIHQAGLRVNPAYNPDGNVPPQKPSARAAPTPPPLEYFRKPASESPGEKSLLSEEDAKYLLSVIPKRAKGNFTGGDLEKRIWLWNKEGALEFYRLRKDGSGYVMVGWSKDMPFFVSGGGKGSPW